MSIAIILGIIAIGVIGYSQLDSLPPNVSSPKENEEPTAQNVACDQSLWTHVYNTERLQIIDNCKTVSGFIETIRVEKDGDYHIGLKLDLQYADLVNESNMKNQNGNLVVEVICQRPVTQQDAIGACANFSQHIDIPPLGTHVRVTGSYVLDKQHGNWAEIHPVSSIEKIQ